MLRGVLAVMGIGMGAATHATGIAEQLPSLKEFTKEEQREALDKAIQIAESDQRIQDLIAGKEYKKLTGWMSQGEEGAVAKLVFAAGDKKYEVTVDVNSKKVVNIEEANRFNDSFYYIISISSCCEYDGDDTNENGCSG